VLSGSGMPPASLQRKVSAGRIRPQSALRSGAAAMKNVFPSRRTHRSQAPSSAAAPSSTCPPGGHQKLPSPLHSVSPERPERAISARLSREPSSLLANEWSEASLELSSGTSSAERVLSEPTPNAKASAGLEPIASELSAGQHRGSDSGEDGNDSVLEESGVISLMAGVPFRDISQKVPRRSATAVSTEAQTVRESATLLAMNAKPPRAPMADPRDGPAEVIGDEESGTWQQAEKPSTAEALPREVSPKELPRTGSDEVLPSSSEGLPPRPDRQSRQTQATGGNALQHQGESARALAGGGAETTNSIHARLNPEEMSFLEDVLAGRTSDPGDLPDGEAEQSGWNGGRPLPTPEDVFRVSMASEGGFGATRWREAETTSTTLQRQEQLFADPPPGSLDRMLRKEIDAELLQDRQVVDFTHLSVCSRSEYGGGGGSAADCGVALLADDDIDGMAELRERLGALHIAFETARERGQHEKAVRLSEEALGVLLQLEGPEGDAVLDLCEQLVKDYNSLGLRLLESQAFHKAFELLKKAELLTEPTSNLADRPTVRRRLRGVTFNNLGCYYKQRGKLHAALHYLERSAKIEEAAAAGAAENPASTLLNIAATLSTLGRHQSAVEYASDAVQLLCQELGLESSDLVTNVARLLEERQGHEGTISSLSVLSAALYNQAVEREHLGQAAMALEAYEQASAVAKISSGPKSSMAVILSKAERAFRRKAAMQQQQRRPPERDQSGRHASSDGGSNSRARPESAPVVRRVASATLGNSDGASTLSGPRLALATGNPRRGVSARASTKPPAITARGTGSNRQAVTVGGGSGAIPRSQSLPVDRGAKGTATKAMPATKTSDRRSSLVGTRTASGRPSSANLLLHRKIATGAALSDTKVALRTNSTQRARESAAPKEIGREQCAVPSEVRLVIRLRRINPGTWEAMREGYAAVYMNGRASHLSQL